MLPGNQRLVTVARHGGFEFACVLKFLNSIFRKISQLLACFFRDKEFIDQGRSEAPWSLKPITAEVAEKPMACSIDSDRTVKQVELPASMEIRDDPSFARRSGTFLILQYSKGTEQFSLHGLQCRQPAMLSIQECPAKSEYTGRAKRTKHHRHWAILSGLAEVLAGKSCK